MSRFAFYCALALIFLRVSFLHETVTFLTGVNTYVLYIFGPIAFVGILLDGGVQRTFREKIGKYWLGFAIWMALAVPFSSWVGGSFEHVIGYLRTDLCMLLVTAGLAKTWSDCKRIMAVIAAAALFNLGTAHFFIQTTSSDRLALSWGGTIANSNDLAAHLLLVLPFLLFFAIKPATSSLIRLIALLGIAIGIYQVLHTGSRGGLVALTVTTLFVLVTGTAKQRTAIAIVAPLALIALLSLIPSSTWKRLMSFSESGTASEEAMESSEAREYLFRQSVVYTIHRPIFGVGPGQFSSYEGSTVTSQGLRGNWHETHNTYTQVSSECGIPALIFYVLVLVSTFQLLAKIRKTATAAGKQEIVTAVFCITISLVAFSVATAFVSFAYRFYLPAMSGLVLAIWMAVKQEPALPAAALPPTIAVRPLKDKELQRKERVFDASFRHHPAL